MYKQITYEVNAMGDVIMESQEAQKQVNFNT